MLSFSFHYIEDETLPSGTNNSYHVQSKSLKDTDGETSLLNSRLAKWVLLLSQYDMKIVPKSN